MGQKDITSLTIANTCVLSLYKTCFHGVYLRLQNLKQNFSLRDKR